MYILHRIRRAAKLGIHSRKRSLGFFDRILVCNRRGGFRHQQRLGIRSLVVNLDAHVVDHADDVLNRLGIEHIVRQMVVNLGVGQITALFAKYDQIL